MALPLTICTLQVKNVFPLAMIHVLGNVLTNISLGLVAVSFTHTVKVCGLSVKTSQSPSPCKPHH